MNNEELIELYNNPKNKRKINGGVSGDYNNESCGDYVNISLIIKNNIVEDAVFDGEGCSLSMVTADLLCEYIKNKRIEEIKKINYEKLIELLGFTPSIGRVNCVRSALNALQNLLNKINF
jgi:nitrogen fixation protein NifU and related proteins